MLSTVHGMYPRIGPSFKSLCSTPILANPSTELLLGSDTNSCKSKHQVPHHRKSLGSLQMDEGMAVDEQRQYPCSFADSSCRFLRPSSGDATRGRSLESLSGLGGAFHFSRGCRERHCATPPTNSTLNGLIGAPLLAAISSLRNA